MSSRTCTPDAVITQAQKLEAIARLALRAHALPPGPARDRLRARVEQKLAALPSLERAPKPASPSA